MRIDTAVFKEGTNANDLISAGMSVDVGEGLRIYGRNDRTTLPTESTDAAWARLGRLEIYAQENDFIFHTNHRLMLNDFKTGANPETDPANEAIIIKGRGDTFARASNPKDATVVLMSASALRWNSATETQESSYWITNDDGKYVPKVGSATGTNPKYAFYPLINAVNATSSSTDTAVGMLANRTATALGWLANWLNTIGLIPLHFAKSGILIGAGDTAYESSQGIGRRANDASDSISPA